MKYFEIPYANNGLTFMNVRHDNNPVGLQQPAFLMFGIPLDSGTTNRPGARGGPDGIRLASTMLNDGHHFHHKVSPKDHITDIGNLPIDNSNLKNSLKIVEDSLNNLWTEDVPVLVGLGGDHTATLPILKSLYKKHGQISLLHFDAHVDTWPTHLHEEIGHGSMFYHAINEKIINPLTSLQIGIRSPVPVEVINWNKKVGLENISAALFHDSYVHEFNSLINHIMFKVAKAKNIYISFDIDCLDPSQAPGTGTPEIGGLFTHQIIKLLRVLVPLIKNKIVGFDLMEVSPAYDISQITTLAGATILYEIMCGMITKDATPKDIPFE